MRWHLGQGGERGGGEVGERSVRQAGHAGSLPIVDDEGGNFFCTRETRSATVQR